MNRVFAFGVGTGSLRFTIDTELDNLGAAVHKGNATVTFKCNGGNYYSVTDGTASDSNTTPGIIDIASSAVGFTGKAGCDTNGEDIRASVSLDGFVTASRSHSFGVPSGTPSRYVTGFLNSGTASLSFTLKVSGVKDELGNTLTFDGTTSSVSYVGGTATVSYSGGSAYISGSPSDTSPVASAGANGFLNKQVAVTPIATAQRTVIFQTGGSATYVGSGLPFAYKFNVYSCCGTSSLVSAHVTAGNSSSVVCTESSGVYYCAVPAAHTGTTATAAKSGYDSATLPYSLRASNRIAQITGSIYPVLNSSNAGGSSYVITQASAPTPTPVSTPNVSPEAVTPTPTPLVSESPLLSVTPTPSVSVVRLYRKVSDPKVYVQGSDGMLHWVKSLGEFNSAGYKWSDVKLISGSEFAKLVVAGKLRVKNGIKLNVRDSASLKGKVITKISSGEAYDKKGTSGTWFKIILSDGREGWIHSAYVNEE